jgi:hypothetical protein
MKGVMNRTLGMDFSLDHCVIEVKRPPDGALVPRIFRRVLAVYPVALSGSTLESQ